MKDILQILWLLIYRQSPYYIINKITYGDTKYVVYWLYRKDYILYFIPKLVPIDRFNNLGDWRPKLANWYKLYDERLNGKHTIEVKEYEAINKNLKFKK